MIDRTQIIRGPCKITYDGQTFYTREGVVLNFNRNMSAVPVDGFGTVDQYFTGLSITAEFVPHGSLQQSALDKLFSCVLLAPGTSVFGATDKTLVITSAAETVTLVNAAITRPPGLLLQAGRPPLNSVQFTGLVGKNADPALLVSYIITDVGNSPGAEILRQSMYSGTYQAAWDPTAGVSGWPDNFHSEGGFEVAVTLGLSPVNVDGIGPVDMTVTNLEAQVRCVPIGVPPGALRQALAPMAPGKSVFYPGPAAGPYGPLVISTVEVAPKYFSFNAGKAALSTGANRWKADQNRVGQVVFNLLREYDEAEDELLPLFSVNGQSA